MIEKLRARGVPIRHPSELCGPARDVGGARVEVLAPCPSFDPDRGANDNSLVLRIRYGDRAALLVGDAEHEEENTLLATRPESLRADLLKVGHHGSRTSTGPAFLAAVAPEVAVISTGVRNRYGHPFPTTLETLAAAHVRIERTDRGGAVVWTTDGRAMRLDRPGDDAIAGETL
jgi:competence protein ComEC